MTEKKRMGRPPSGRPHKKLRSIKLEPDFDLQLAAAAYWCPGVTINSIIEEGAALVLERLKEKHNKGEDFPPPPEE